MQLNVFSLPKSLILAVITACTALSFGCMPYLESPDGVFVNIHDPSDSGVDSGGAVDGDTESKIPPVDCSAKGYQAMWGSAANDIYAVGLCGEAAHFDGTGWAKIELGTLANLYGIWGSSSSDVYAVGARTRMVVGKDGAWRPESHGVVLHYNGRSWFTLFEDSAPDTTLNAVWGSGPNDVYVTGRGVALRFNGEFWTRSKSTSKIAIWGCSASAIFAVGADCSVAPDACSWGVISRFDGAQWQVWLEDHSTSDFRGIWGTTTEDIFIVGGQGAISHYDGTSWSSMDSTCQTVLNSVWGSSSADVYAVGSAGAVAHFNGFSWQRQAELNSDLVSVFGISANDVYAAGSAADELSTESTGVIFHYDGQSWQTVFTDR